MFYVIVMTYAKLVKEHEASFEVLDPESSSLHKPFLYSLYRRAVNE